MKLDYHGDRVIVEPRGNVRIQTQTPAQGILSAMAMLRQQVAEERDTRFHAQKAVYGVSLNTTPQPYWQFELPPS
jgi:hypothetical protein